MTRVDPETVSRIAALAALDVSPDDRSRVAADLGAILSWIDALADLPADASAPGSEVAVGLRPDEVTSLEDSSAATANAPDLVDGRYRVPSVVDR